MGGEKQSFLLKLEDGTEVTVPFPENYREKLGEFFDSKRNFLYISVIASYDPAGKLKKIIVTIQVPPSPEKWK
jgi:hypothetical protein